MKYSDVQCRLCLWWCRKGSRAVFGTCTESPPSTLIEIKVNGELAKRWKQPLMPEDGNCSRFVHKDTGDDVDY